MKNNIEVKTVREAVTNSTGENGIFAILKVGNEDIIFCNGKPYRTGQKVK